MTETRHFNLHAKFQKNKFIKWQNLDTNRFPIPFKKHTVVVQMKDETGLIWLNFKFFVKLWNSLKNVITKV